MKYINLAGFRVKFPSGILIAIATNLLIFSCEPEKNTIGVDIFPSGDTILVFTDTITDFKTRLVTSRPRITSESFANASSNRLYYLGSMHDSITGFTKAEIVSSLGIFSDAYFGDEPYVDSLLLTFYFSAVEGDTNQEMRVRVYEFLDTLFYNRNYYSNYDVTGKYDPEPLVDKIITPKPNTYYEFDITDEEYVNRLINATYDTLNTEEIKDDFRGFYITTEPVASGGALARIQMASGLSGLRFRYLHDSVLVDTASLDDYNSFTVGFHELFAQKVNIFEHDFTGTALEGIIDNPDAEPEIAYAQGLAGVNTVITFPDFSDIIGEGIIALNAANLVFYTVPDSISGIPPTDLPFRLDMETGLPDGTFQPLYDEVINSATTRFGRLQQSNEISAFLEPLYYYRFPVGRHFQSVINGEFDGSDLVIFVNEPQSTTDVIKFWSNYSGRKGGLQLELIYTKY